VTNTACIYKPYVQVSEASPYILPIYAAHIYGSYIQVCVPGFSIGELSLSVCVVHAVKRNAEVQ